MTLRAAYMAIMALLAGCAAGGDPARPERFERSVLVSDMVLSQGDRVAFSSSAKARIVRLQGAGPASFEAALSCSKPARAKTADGQIYVGKAPVRFLVPGRHQPSVAIHLPAGFVECQLTNKVGTLQISAAPRPTQPSPACPTRSMIGDPLGEAFFASHRVAETCAVAAGPVEIVDEELAALAWRIEALSGTKPPRAALRAGRPDMALDFSKAPQLDQIDIAYLHMRADFSGAIMARLLDYHAARGARVRILLTSSLMRGKDLALFEKLAARHANVALQAYIAEPAANARLLAHFDQIHRSNHTKVFAATGPRKSFALVGGRNLHDGYFFNQGHDLSAYPALRNYRDESGVLDGLDIFEDFEVALRDPAAVAQVVTQYDQLWHRDRAGQRLAAPRAQRSPPLPSVQSGAMRHIQSIPMADGEALSAYFIEMIDAAQSEIVIAAPFFYPPADVDAALLRAAARGVHVRIVSRLLSGEVHARFTVALNRAYLATRDEVFEVDSYQPVTKVLHTKLMTIDGRFAMVGSINMNPRSFEQDTENALVFLDHPVIGGLQATLERYVVDGERLDWVPKTALSDLLLYVPWLHRFF